MKVLKFITEANKQKVCKLLGMTEMQYCQYQQQKGLEYLELILGVDGVSQECLAKNGLYWRWWINHWNRRDAEFLTYAAGAPWRMRLRYYESLNSLEGFEFHPHKTIMEESYRLLNEVAVPVAREVMAC